MIASILIDSREPDSVKRLGFYGAKKSILEMEFGDLWVTCDDGSLLVIERKEPEDFIGSMLSGRMLRQANGLSKLRDAGMWPYIMIMGDFMPGPNGRTYVNGDLRDVQYSAIQGLLLSIQELGVFVIHALNHRDLEQAVLRLSNRTREPIMKIPAAKREGRTRSKASDFLSGLPGISMGLAEGAIQEAGSAAKALTMMTDGSWLPNIGEKRREQVRKVLGLGPNQKLEIRNMK